MAKKLYLNLVLIALALMGIVDASFITYEKLSGRIPPCIPGFQCAAVLESPWASIGPIPLSAVGAVFYSCVLVVALLLYGQIQISPILNRWADKLKIKPTALLRFISTEEILLGLTSFGALFSIYLISVMAFLIKGWCTYCIISAITCALLFITTLIYYHLAGQHSPFIAKWVMSAISRFIYKNILRRFFFNFDSETIHNFLVKSGAFLTKFWLVRLKMSILFGFYHPDLAVKLAGIRFSNRVGLAAGFDYDGDLVNALPSVGFGWHTIGTTTLEPYAGNPKPRLSRFIASRSLLVNKGLKTIGARALISKLRQFRFKIPVAISIASTNKSFADTKSQILDILSCFKLFEKSGLKHTLYELNISCPNTFGGEPFTTPARLSVLLTALDKLKITRPILVKMPIDQSEKETLALLSVMAKHQVAGVIFGNLTKDKNNQALTSKDRQVWKNQKGNASGKPTWERSNALIALTKKHYPLRFIIVGTGGIFSPEDAATKIELGADLIQLITGMVFEGPELIGQINHFLARKMVKTRYVPNQKN